MPLISLRTSVKLTEDIKSKLLPALSQSVARCTGKSERYVMACVEDAAISMSGTNDPAAWIEVKSIGGINPSVNSALCKELCSLLWDTLGIRGERCYIVITNVAASHWGCNGETFG